MSSRLSSHVHENQSPDLTQDLKQDGCVQIAIPPRPHEPESMQADPVDYMARAQWLRAVVLGANDGLVSVASLMVGVGAVGQSAKAMLVSGLAGLVAGACSMAIGEFVSVYAQYDIEVAERERRRQDCGSEEEGSLPNPLLAAVASALAFSLGAVLPLLAGGFIRSWGVRVGAVCAVSSLGLAGFGAAGAVLGGANVPNSVLRLLFGGWLAMLVTYGVLRVFGIIFGMHVSSA
ncbi:vacuolar iron transporter homolog 2-like [Musa acuminata AAA Group]|uniref:vacuolar iron transporter homolog 2-like n=1 Tax=Musa acuminata AAA Group TaxID=214697 RepID=UPI0031E0BBC7